MGDTATSSRARTLPKAARVRKRSEFLTIQRGGRRLSTRHFLLAHRSGPAPRARLGVTVTRKIGGAVIRNRVKRHVREAFRHARGILPARDLVVIARQGSGLLSAHEVAAELGAAFDQLRGTRPG